jgi:hypothetical protein
LKGNLICGEWRRSRKLALWGGQIGWRSPVVETEILHFA